MPRLLPVLAAVVSIGVVLGIPVALAASQQITLAPGDSVTVTCGTQLSAAQTAQQAATVLCVAVQPTATPTLTVTPTPAGGVLPAVSGGTRAQPVAGQMCPQWVHDQYATTAPDGKTYPTWHPPIDPQYGCYFGHEHGADPRTSAVYTRMPPFGYAAATMGMTEPHTGFKVFVMNAGETVESNVASKTADEDVMFVFHMGTGGVGRYSQEFHSFQLDFVDRSGTGSYAHLTGMTDTGPTSSDGSTCDNPRRGAKDFSTLGCPNTYEIWNAARFQIIDPADQFTGIDQTRFGMLPSFAVFDPITTRDPADNTRLIYTQDVKPNPGNMVGIPATSPDAYFLGCRREFYAGPLYFHNAGQQSVYYTDALGRVSLSGPDSTHQITQQLSSTNFARAVIWKKRTDYCGNQIRPPN